MTFALALLILTQPHSNPEWLGTYYGKGWGTTNFEVTLLPGGDVKIFMVGCFTRHPSRATWDYDGEQVTIRQRIGKRKALVEDRFYPISWAGRHFLVEDSEMPWFAASARGFTNPWKMSPGSTFAQWEEHPARAAGGPNIPAEYRRFYDQGQIHCRITAKVAYMTFKLDRGSSDGLKKGMVLIDNMDNLGDYFVMKVTGADPHTSVCKLVAMGYANVPDIKKITFTTGNARSMPFDPDADRAWNLSSLHSRGGIARASLLP